MTAARLVLVAFLVMRAATSWAQSSLDSVYGKWVRVEPHEVTKTIPEYQPPRSQPGAVTNEYKRKPEGLVHVHSFQNPLPAPFVKAERR